MHAYNAVLEGDESYPVLLSDEMPILRADIGKLAETVHSCGITAYSGTDQNPEDFSAAGGLAELFEQETAYGAAISAERDVEHQMRTRAVLDNIESNSVRRAGLLKDLQKSA